MDETTALPVVLVEAGGSIFFEPRVAGIRASRDLGYFYRIQRWKVQYILRCRLPAARCPLPAATGLRRLARRPIEIAVSFHSGLPPGSRGCYIILLVLQQASLYLVSLLLFSMPNRFPITAKLTLRTRNCLKASCLMSATGTVDALTRRIAAAVELPPNNHA